MMSAPARRAVRSPRACRPWNFPAASAAPGTGTARSERQRRRRSATGRERRKRRFSSRPDGARIRDRQMPPRASGFAGTSVHSAQPNASGGAAGRLFPFPTSAVRSAGVRFTFSAASSGPLMRCPDGGGLAVQAGQDRVSGDTPRSVDRSSGGLRELSCRGANFVQLSGAVKIVRIVGRFADDVSLFLASVLRSAFEGAGQRPRRATANRSWRSVRTPGNDSVERERPA